MQAWDAFLHEQEKELGKETVQRWLKPLKVVNFDAGNLYLQAQDSFQISWFNEHIQPRLKTKLFSSTGRRIKVHLSLQDESYRRHAKKDAEGQKEKIYRPALNLSQDTLDPEATLENFFPTNANELLMKFVREMLTQTSTKNSLPNPLFIHGESGSGKSHLLMAIAQQIQSHGSKAFFVRAETFMEHVVAAIRNGAMNEFRVAYRHVDVLIVDDVHFFARKGATQEEFFHTFNALHSSGKQIILSANCAPQFLEAIEPRLISRFEWGIVLRLEKMRDDETKSWMKKRAATLSLPLDDGAINFLVKTLNSQTKSLQSALHSLTLRSHLNPVRIEKIDAEKVQTLLADFLAKEKQKELNPQKILRAVADYYGVKTDDLLGKSQTKEVAAPRQMAMHLCRHLLRLPYLKIGLIFSRDHSTVMSSVKQVEKKIKDEEKETCSAKVEISRQLQLKT